jgi:hypothetical protein
MPSILLIIPSTRNQPRHERPSPAQVARELGLTENAVVQPKFRILKRLREEAGELLD